MNPCFPLIERTDDGNAARCGRIDSEGESLLSIHLCRMCSELFVQPAVVATLHQGNVKVGQDRAGFGLVHLKQGKE